MTWTSARTEAKAKGDKVYLSTRPCPQGHLGERYTSTTWCVECAVIAGVENNTLQYKAKQKESRQNRKKSVITALGGKCNCCKESELVFLCLDHKKGGGNAHRVSIRGHKSGGLYVWILRQIKALGIKAVKRDFRLLCWNCNAAHAILGYCPHKKRKC